MAPWRPCPASSKSGARCQGSLWVPTHSLGVACGLSGVSWSRFSGNSPGMGMLNSPEHLPQAHGNASQP